MKGWTRQSWWATTACAATACAQPVVLQDPLGDAALRRTDSGANGPVHPSGRLPDLVSVFLQGWAPTGPSSPWTGQTVPGSDADVFRLDLVFAGVVNPPGPIGVGGGPEPYRFGPSPVYGFIEIEMDGDLDTGGEAESIARSRYLGSMARFGRRPTGPAGARIATWAKDHNAAYQSAPWYERNGAEFVLQFCGCLETSVLFETNAPAGTPGVFDAGETWVVLDRYFQRSGGYECASGAFGGTVFGAYDPPVMLKWSHSTATDRTTVSFVGALTMEGAAALAGQPVEPANYSLFDHTSVYEALRDVADHAAGLTGFCGVIASRWLGRDPADALDPEQWAVRALVGTAYAEPQDSLYAWTDTGFAETAADLTGDGVANSADRTVVQQTVAALDGTSDDADGVVNGVVRIVDFGPNFHLVDITGDGVINALDIAAICPADYNGDGVLSVGDLGSFQLGWVTHDPRADFNRDGLWNVADFGSFQSAFAGGCP